jgi:acetoin utilization protein AcuB
MRVRDVMSDRVQTVPPAYSAEDAYQVMRIKGVHHLAVTDGPRLVGLFSDRDAGSRRGTAIRRQRTVAELMTPTVVSIGPEASVRQAANLMRGRSIGSLIVSEGSHIVGIVTVSDLLEVLGGGVDRPAPSARPVLKHRAPHKKRARAAGVW